MRSRACLALLIGAFLAAAAVNPAQAQRTHVVQQGETLWSIAQQYDLSVQELRRLNDLRGNLIRAGQRLVVRRATSGGPPASGGAGSTDARRRAPPSSGSSQRPSAPLSDREYVAGRGETLFSIADRYGLSADTLWQLNDRPTAPLDSGRVLSLPLGGIRGTHRVRSGESLSIIAQRYGASLQDLRRVNPEVRGNRIYTGQVLRLPAGAAGASARAGLDTLSGRVQGYPSAFAGRLTASGTPYAPGDFTVSHGSLPLGTVVLLTNPATDRRTFAVVNDRGPLSPDFLLEASDAVLRALRLSAGSEQAVSVRVVE